MNHKKTTILLFVILICFTNSLSAQKDISTQIDSLMKWSNENGIFNGNILVSKNNEVIYKSSFGYTNSSKTTKLTNDYKFNIGSITKEFSAIALLQLKEKDKLELSDKVSKFLPELPQWANEVTIRDLLQYTSGIPDVNWKKIKSNEDIFEDIKSIHTLKFKPGTAYNYNNNNFFLRLSIIERITGIKYKDYNYIFMPNSMSTAEITPIEEVQNIAIGFNNKLIDDKPDFLVGGAFVTTADLLKFLNQLHSNKIISKKSLYELGKQFQENAQSSLGKAEYRNKHLIRHMHDGRGGNYDAIMISDLENNFDIILLSNNYQGKLFEISDAIVAILNNQEYILPQEVIDTK